jgi:4-aminobutyrate aminotransferase
LRRVRQSVTEPRRGRRVAGNQDGRHEGSRNGGKGDGQAAGPISRKTIVDESSLFGNTFRVRVSPLVVVRAKGLNIWDADGRKYLDFSAGGSVTNTGYCHPEVVKASQDEVARLTHGLSPLFPNPPMVELAHKLVKLTPGDFDKRIWFGASGSDAAETVYDFLPSAAKRRRVITFFGSHHGLTVGANFLSGHPVSNRYLQSPIVTKVPYPYCYRCPFKRNSDLGGDGCCNKSVDFIENDVFTNICPTDDVAAILVEPVEGLAGEIVPPDDFLPQLRELCDRHGIFLVDDEVKTGMGRTGKMFAIEHSAVVPDVMILGKPLASGLPLSAVVGERSIMDSEKFSHLASGAGHPVSCAAGVATIDVIERERLVENSARMGKRMMTRLIEMMDSHPIIGDVRGKGLFVGVELVKDRKSKAPASKEASKVAFRSWQLGVVFITDGTLGNNIEISPALTISKDELDSGLEIFERAITDVERGQVPDSSLDQRNWV